jgi:iron complex outermembrane receptor protein
MKFLKPRPLSRSHRRLVAAGIILSVLQTVSLRAVADELAPTPAPAPSTLAPAPGANSSLDEVVVTATRRTSRLLDIPASITALSGENLQRAGADDYRTILAAQPGVAFFDIGYQRNMTFIRGVSGGTGSYVNPTTGTYIDDVPVTEIRGQTLDIGTFDIADVEILRGPQGTLYGAGSMGGTIRVTTNQPKLDVFEGLASTGVSDTAHGGVNYHVDGMINLPLNEELALRLVVTRKYDDGFIDNIVTGQRNVNTALDDQFRGELLFHSAEGTDILLSGYYQDRSYGGMDAQDLNTPAYTQARYYPESGDSRSKFISLNITQDFGFAKLTSTTSYIDKDAGFVRDVTFVQGPAIAEALGTSLSGGSGYNTQNNYEAFTEEARLQSKGDSRLTWIAGVFFQNLQPHLISFFLYPADPAYNAAEYYSDHEQYNLRQIAGFGELTYKLTDTLSATVGIRAENVKGTSVDNESGLLIGTPAVDTIIHSNTTTSVQKYNLSWKPTDNNLLYAQASQGFRPGGPTSVPYNECAANLQALGYSSSPTQYKSDALWSYELGSKTSLFDKKFSINSAIYHIDWSNIQAERTLDCGFQFIGNVGRAQIDGAELELSAEPIEGLRLGASGAYTGSRVLTAEPDIGADRDDQLPLVSKWTGNVNAQYSFAVPGQSDAFTRADVQYIGSRWNDFQGVGSGAVVDQPAFATLNLRVGLQHGPWETEIYATNVTDSRGIVYANRDTFIYNVLVRPRTVGIDINRSF